jgi:hypothetical protein
MNSLQLAHYQELDAFKIVTPWTTVILSYSLVAGSVLLLWHVIG